jgi:hypothetical protein
MPQFFKDIGKTGNDLLVKKYPQNFEVTAETTLCKGDDHESSQKTQLTSDGEGQVAANFNPKWNLKSKGVNLSAKIYTSKKLELEISNTGKIAEGLKTVLKVTAPAFEQIGSSQGQQIKAEAEYKAEKVAVTASVDLVNEKPAATLSVVTAKDRLQGGLDVAYALGSSPDIKSLAAVVGFTGDAFQWTLSRKANERYNGKVSYGVNVYQQIDANLQLAAEVNYDASAEKAAPSILVGGQYKLDNSSVKAKFGSNGRVGIAYSQELNYFSRATFGLDLNAGDSKDHKLGLLLEFHD